MLKYITFILLCCTSAFAENISLTTANTVTFRGPVDGTSITKAQLELVQQVKTRGKSNYPIYLVMDSPGGSIYAGEAFIEFTKTIQNLQTISIFAASMASAIVEALPGTRNVTPTGILMFHRAQGSFQGFFETGEIESELKLWKEIVLDMETTNAARLQLPIKDYKEKVAIEWWGYGRGAVEDKMADKLTTVTCSAELIDATEIVTQDMGFFGALVQTYSKCPLIRAPLPKEGE